VPKLRVLSGDEVCAILARQGFTRVRQRGTHAVMQKRSAAGSVTVPVPLHDDLAEGTLRSIIRQSGLPRHLFEAG